MRKRPDSSTLRVLAAAIDTIIPADDFSGGWDGGVRDFVDREWGRDLLWVHGAVESLVRELGSTFAALDPEDRMQRWADFASSKETAAAAEALVRVAREGYYGGSSANRPGGWDLLGYRPWPFSEQPSPVLPPEGIHLTQLRRRYDVVVIGSGPGGGVAARVLAESGASVLLIERAPSLTDAQLAGDHLHGKRMAVYRPLAGPGQGNPREVLEEDGTTWTADGASGGDEWGLNAMVLGGGTRLWQGMAWRFLPEDFIMASSHGVPDGSSLVDWPVNYSDIAAGYDWAERELGVSGATGVLTSRMPGHPGYGMPALPGDPVGDLLGRAAQSLGWKTGPIPFAINSIPRNGRAACAECWQCMGHACPVGAKNGSHTDFIPQALQTGRCDLLLEAQAVGIEHTDGVARGVVLVSAGQRITVGCDTVVVAAGAIETPRLLLASRLGNDHVGRHLQGHAVTLLVGRTRERVPTFRGPGHSIATMDFVHDGGPAGGGVLFDAFAPYPLQLAGWVERMTRTKAGAEHKKAIREAVGHVVGIMSMAQEMPHPESRVELAAGLTDNQGMPAVRIRRAIHPLTLANRERLIRASQNWLQAAGCTDIVDLFTPGEGSLPARRSPASEHSAGTVRMGLDPASSAAGADGLVWGSRNVYVCDGSLLPTNGSVNPTLTMIANAYRVATGIAGGHNLTI